MPESRTPFALQQPPEPGPVRPLPYAEPYRGLPRKWPDEPQQMETVDLMRRLQAEHGPMVAGARTELMHRGFTAVHLELARRLFDPDPEVRKKLVRSLPGLQSIDAVPWLLWLSRDANREVRMAAISLVATTGDPALLEQVEQIARHDPDPQIQRQAERLARRRTGRPY